jgi:hypothetical protein
MYKIIEQRMYTEVVFYNDDGTEAGRETHFDDHLYDSSGKESLTDSEMEDWGEE